MANIIIHDNALPESVSLPVFLTKCSLTILPQSGFLTARGVTRQHRHIVQELSRQLMMVPLHTCKQHSAAYRTVRRQGVHLNHLSPSCIGQLDRRVHNRLRVSACLAETPSGRWKAFEISQRREQATHDRFGHMSRGVVASTKQVWALQPLSPQITKICRYCKLDRTV